MMKGWLNPTSTPERLLMDYAATGEQKYLTLLVAQFNLPLYHFADGQGDKNRFIIDSSWYGELPRSYFVEANGKFHGKSGLIKEALLTQWLMPEVNTTAE